MKKLFAFLLCIFGTTLSTAYEWDAKTFEKFKNSKPKVLIIGAAGSVAREATAGFLQTTNATLRLFLRNAKRLESIQKANPNRVELFEGDATDLESLKTAMQGVDVVYANLAGSNLPKMAAQIVAAMKAAGVQRIIWIATYGLYESEGRGKKAPANYAESAKIVEESGLNYTIIRPQWFSSADEIDYELTQKGEVFKNPNAQISRKSIAHLVIRLSLDSTFGNRQSLGINKPEK